MGKSRRSAWIIHSVLTLLGAAMLLLLGRVLHAELAPYGWDEVDCRILESRVRWPERPADTSYVPEVRYSYVYGGREHVSERVAGVPLGDSDYRKAQRIHHRFPAGREATCYVNPDDPVDSVLIHHFTWWPLPLLLLPLAFLLFGIHGLTRLVTHRHYEGRSTEHRRGGRVAGLVFFGLFLFPGLLYLFLGVIGPAIHVKSAERWEVLPCDVVRSRYVVLPGDSDDPFEEYAPDILFSYTYRGREYRSNTYDFYGLTSMDLDFVKGILAKYVPGSTRSCHVNPEAPDEAVLVPDFRPESLLSGLIALPFIAFGAWGYFRIFRH